MNTQFTRLMISLLCLLRFLLIIVSEKLSYSVRMPKAVPMPEVMLTSLLTAA